MRADDELRRPAADVDGDVGRGLVEPGGRAQEGQLRFRGAGQQLGLEMQHVGRGPQEVGAIAGVPGRARRGGTRPLDTQLVESAAVLAQHVQGAGDRLRVQAAGLVDALAEPRDPHAPVERLELG